jgi:hypothetical protein
VPSPSIPANLVGVGALVASLGIETVPRSPMMYQRHPDRVLPMLALTSSEDQYQAPVGTIAVDALGNLQKLFGSGWFGIIEEPNGEHWLAYGQEDIELPAQVLRWGQ